MNTMKKSIFAAMTLVLGMTLASCSDANEYEDAQTGNPSFGTTHPETLANTKWVRGTGIHVNAFGQDIQGFVESLDFVTADSVCVKMSEPTTMLGTYNWTDESNNEKTPLYEYTYSDATGSIQILKRTVNDKGAVTKTAIFSGVATTGGTDVITLLHFGDTPSNTYLVKQ